MFGPLWKFIVGFGLIAMISFPGMADAGLITFNSRAAFNAAGGAFLPTETFETATVAAGNIAPFLGPLSIFSNNSVFDPGDILPGIAFGDSTNVMLAFGTGTAFPGATKMIGGSPGALLFSAAIGSPFTLFGADLFDVGLRGPIPFGVVVNTTAGTSIFAAAAAPTGAFFGIKSTDPILSIAFAPLGLPVVEGIDNVTFGTSAVPELSTWAMMLLGFGLVGLRLSNRNGALAVGA